MKEAFDGETRVALCFLLAMVFAVIAASIASPAL